MRDRRFEGRRIPLKSRDRWALLAAAAREAERAQGAARRAAGDRRAEAGTRPDLDASPEFLARLCVRDARDLVPRIRPRRWLLLSLRDPRRLQGLLPARGPPPARARPNRLRQGGGRRCRDRPRALRRLPLPPAADARRLDDGVIIATAARGRRRRRLPRPRARRRRSAGRADRGADAIWSGRARRRRRRRRRGRPRRCRGRVRG
mmetsp:Transcript_14081/g.44411  ORF Transcript_14081/g.44411 Transcript_14081/m.44411 type:complete len:205 (+) Transcript_14081:120-734(+)